jgi:hypothetical protein
MNSLQPDFWNIANGLLFSSLDDGAIVPHHDTSIIHRDRK